MSNAVLIDIADCVASDYAAAFGLARISQPLRVQRGHIPIFVPGEQSYGVYQVFVSHDKEEPKRVSRGSIDVEYTIEVGVCCRLRDTENGTVDPALLLIQQMGDFFFDFGLSNNAGIWQKNEVYFWGDKDRLKFDGAFFALWDITFRGMRSR